MSRVFVTIALTAMLTHKANAICLTECAIDETATTFCVCPRGGCCKTCFKSVHPECAWNATTGSSPCTCDDDGCCSVKGTFSIESMLKSSPTGGGAQVGGSCTDNNECGTDDPTCTYECRKKAPSDIMGACYVIMCQSGPVAGNPVTGGSCSYQAAVDACLAKRGAGWGWTCTKLGACKGSDFCGPGTQWNGSQCVP